MYNTIHADCVLGHSWSLQSIICPAIAQRLAGPGNLDKGGFRVKINQKNLPERTPALTQQQQKNPTAPHTITCEDGSGGSSSAL